MARFLEKVAAAGYHGVMNCPTVALIDGKFRSDLEETGMGFAREVEVLGQASRMGLFTKAFCTTPDEALAMAEAGVDNIIVHFGNSSGGTIGSKTVMAHDAALARAAAILDALSAKFSDRIMTCHGGAIETPADVERFLAAEPRLDGYVGGSSAERFPIEKSVVEVTRRSAASGCRRPKAARWRNSSRSASSPRSTASTRPRAFVCDALAEAGVTPWLVDLSLRPHAQGFADVGGAEVAAAAGTSWAALAALSRADAAQTMIAGGSEIVQARQASGAIDGVLGVGGANGSTMACAIMRRLPLAFPKAMVTPVAATAAVQWYVAESDIAMFPTIGDIWLNRITRAAMANAAEAVAGMAKARRGGTLSPPAPAR